MYYNGKTKDNWNSSSELWQPWAHWKQAQSSRLSYYKTAELAMLRGSRQQAFSQYRCILALILLEIAHS